MNKNRYNLDALLRLCGKMGAANAPPLKPPTVVRGVADAPPLKPPASINHSGGGRGGGAKRAPPDPAARLRLLAKRAPKITISGGKQTYSKPTSMVQFRKQLEESSPQVLYQIEQLHGQGLLIPLIKQLKKSML